MMLILWKHATHKYLSCMLIMCFDREKSNTCICIIYRSIIRKFFNFFYIFIKGLLISKPFRQFFKNFFGIQ